MPKPKSKSQPKSNPKSNPKSSQTKSSQTKSKTQPKTKSHKIFWYRGQKCRNFGDLISPYLYTKFTQKEPKFVNPTKNPDKQHIYLTVGSILSWSNPNTIIWGSGIISKKERLKKPHKVISTRGPLTYQHFKTKFPKLKLPNPPIYGDPALLLPRFYQPNQTTRKYQLGIVPHKVDYKKIKQLLKGTKLNTNTNIKLIKLDIPYTNEAIHRVIDEINECEHILSSSLHGIIVAHAYQIPATWVKFSNKLYGDDIKFHDYFQSLPNFPEAQNIQPLILKNTNTLNFNDIEKDIQRTPQPQFPIDTQQLWESCPFHNNNKN